MAHWLQGSSHLKTQEPLALLTFPIGDLQANGPYSAAALRTQPSTGATCFKRRYSSLLCCQSDTGVWPHDIQVTTGATGLSFNWQKVCAERTGLRLVGSTKMMISTYRRALQ